jgi:hypothetical protein
MSARIAATVVCPSCPWRAKNTADTVLEADEFLRRLLNQHIVEGHKQ